MKLNTYRKLNEYLDYENFNDAQITYLNFLQNLFPVIKKKTSVNDIRTKNCF